MHTDIQPSYIDIPQNQRFCGKVPDSGVISIFGKVDSGIIGVKVVLLSNKIRDIHHLYDFLSNPYIAIIKNPNNNQKRRTNGSSPVEKRKRALWVALGRMSRLDFQQRKTAFILSMFKIL